MKNQIKATVAITGICLSTLLFAFKDNGNAADEEGKERKIEVIRTIDGETQHYDTIVPSTSSLTPEQYLEILGFENDPVIQIVDLTKDEQENVFHMEKEETFTVDEEGNGSKNVKMVNEINLEIDVDDMEDLDLDSLISSFVVKNLDGESQEFETQVMIIETTDEDSDTPHNVTWHTSEEPIYHHIEEDSNRISEVKVYGDNEDVTLVIVSGDTRKIRVVEPSELDNEEISSIKVFPNPTYDILNLQYEFEDQAATTIMINDNSGREVMKIERGEESGFQDVDIQVSDWPAGIYLVNVLHGGSKTVRKVVIE